MPPRGLEYGYYVFLVYSTFGTLFGLSIPMLAGITMLVLAMACICRVWPAGSDVYEPIFPLLACGLSFLFIQLVVHKEPESEEVLRTFIVWMLGLIIVTTLQLREGFLHRCAALLFVTGLFVLPYLGELGTRARVEVEVGGNLTNANGLAEWFGFAAVYFGTHGIESRRGSSRLAAWVIALGCLFIVGLTVSRGSLLAAILAIAVASRRLLKRGPAPILALLILVAVIAGTGLFEHAANQYSERAMEETGRERLWPAAVERILGSPLVGVGVSNIGLYAMSPVTPHPPHNSFLYFALSSGVVPTSFWIFFWIRAFWRAARDRKRLGEAPFRLPLLIYSFIVVMVGDLQFVSPWAFLALPVATGTVVLSRSARARSTRITDTHAVTSSQPQHEWALNGRVRRSGV